MDFQYIVRSQDSVYYISVYRCSSHFPKSDIPNFSVGVGLIPNFECDPKDGKSDLSLIASVEDKVHNASLWSRETSNNERPLCLESHLYLVFYSFQIHCTSTNCDIIISVYFILQNKQRVACCDVRPGFHMIILRHWLFWSVRTGNTYWLHRTHTTNRLLYPGSCYYRSTSSTGLTCTLRFPQFWTNTPSRDSTQRVYLLTPSRTLNILPR